MRAGRGIYNCGRVSFTTTRSARTKNWYKTPGKRDRDINSIYMGDVKLVAFFFARDGFHSFSLVVESKVSLNSCQVLVSLLLLILFYFVRTH